MKKIITTILVIWVSTTTVVDYNRPLGGIQKKVAVCDAEHIQQIKKMR